MGNISQANILYMAAIHKTTCAFDTDKTRLVSKTFIEILSISFVLLLLVSTDGCNLGMPK